MCKLNGEEKKKKEKEHTRTTHAKSIELFRLIAIFVTQPLTKAEFTKAVERNSALE